MDYAGPETADFSNVRALNRDYLRLLASDRQDRLARPATRKRLGSLSPAQTGHLASAPFLLFSLREMDADYWEEVFDAPPTPDLFIDPVSSSAESSRLVAAGMGFLWELARRNPYAARLVSGASLYWCEQIAEQTFCRLLALVSVKQDMLRPRCESNLALWQKLLSDGVSRERVVRDAAHLSALQLVLTDPKSDRQSWPLAARAAQTPGLRIADDASS